MNIFRIVVLVGILAGWLSAKNICDRYLEYEFLHTDNIKEYLHIMSSINQINQELFATFSAYFVSLGFQYHFCEVEKESSEYIRTLEQRQGFNVLGTAQLIFSDNEFTQYTPQCGIKLKEQLVSLYKRLDKASISEKEKQTIPVYLLALGSLHLLCSLNESMDEPVMLFDIEKYEDVPLFKKLENEWRIKIKNYYRKIKQ